MDIKHLGTPAAGTPPASPHAPDENKAAQAKSSNAASAATRQPVEFEPSGEAKALGQAIAQAKTSFDVDNAKVERLRAAIAEGRYPIESETLADNIIRIESEFRGN